MMEEYEGHKEHKEHKEEKEEKEEITPVMNEEEEKKIEEILHRKQGNRRKDFRKAFSFGSTTWENMIKFAAGDDVTDARKGSVQVHHSSESEAEPLIPKDKTDIVGAGSVKTFFNIVKSFVGTGILFLPNAFKDGGIIFSSFILSFIAMVCVYGMLLLVICWEKGRGSFGDVAERALGFYGKIVVNISICLTQFSFGCVYMVFIAETVIQVLDVDWPLFYVILMEIPLLTPLVWIRHVYKLSIANFIGTFCVVLGACYIVYFDLYTIATDGPKEVEFFNSKDFALFLGTAIFTFEGIGTVIPIQQSMKNKEKFKFLLVLAISLITFVLVSFACLGYLTFGEAVKGPITLNLPDDDIFVKIVLSLYALAILFTYPLIVFPGVEIVQKIFFKPGPVTTVRKWKKNFFRFILVCITAGIAIGGGEDFEKFVSLVGGFACTPLGIIFPPLFHLRLVAETRFQKFVDWVMIILGVSMGGFATIYSAYSWAIGE